ncbi:putative ribosomal protein S5 domain 2-type protein [Paratrimastix pyriformis]|uniref:Ribosomal protein S5 domain 2-type protein n=1 Tax=Paratrimastix pyriformis TaxID=342808 RepID=A0ABQ8UFM7_9EUKA|nr:putative ribosomal protein S5 domain 2-type protein [Paratrimastix pyriformis]
MEIPFRCDLGCLNRADGSARLCIGGTDIMASVTGPAPVPARKESIDKATIEVSLHKKIGGVLDNAETEIEVLLKHTLENCILTKLHPSTLITVTVQLMNVEGPIFGVALNAVTLALLDAGVPLAYTPAAVTVASLAPSEGAPAGMCCWPTKAQAEASPCVAQFVFSNVLPHAAGAPAPAPTTPGEEPANPPVEVVSCHLAGQLCPLESSAPQQAGAAALVQLSEMARESSLGVWRFIREALANKTHSA